MCPNPTDSQWFSAMLNLIHWRGVMIRKRFIWCARWCLFLTVSLISVALSASIMLLSLSKDLPDRSEQLADLVRQNTTMSQQLREMQLSVDQRLQAQTQQLEHQAQISLRLSRLQRLSLIDAFRVIAVTDSKDSTVVRLQVGDMAQLRSQALENPFDVRSVQPGEYAVIAELVFSDG
jgi:TolA-binding protein